MRILHIIPSLKKGGAERLCLDIVRAQNKLENIVSVVAVMDQTNEYAEEYVDIKPISVCSYVIPSVSGRWKVETKEWDALLLEFKPDVIHSHLFEAELLSRYTILHSVKYITHCHDNMRQIKQIQAKEVLNKRRLTEYYERQFIIRQYKRSRTIFLAISADTHAYFTEQLPLQLVNQVFLFPNAIDCSTFSAQSATYPNENILKLINIGSFVQKKNQTFLLDVLLHLKQIGIEAELSLLGDGPLWESVKLSAQQKGLNNTRFLGKVSNVEHFLWASHLYVHSAYYEPFGLVLVEAMAAGLPIVCLDGKGNKELIINGENGFRIEDADAEMFARKIKESIIAEHTWDSMSKRAKEIASTYNISSYVDALLSIYKI